jgi:peptide/nickel transport system permease protein
VRLGRIRRSRRLIAGLLALVAVAAAALAAALVGGDPFRSSEAILAGPSWEHPFGTDELGRDILTRLLHGASTSLRVAILPVLAAAIVGATVGLLAGYFGGLLDELLLKIIELLFVVPRFLLALVVAALFGPSIWLIGVVLAVTFWPHTARLVRADAIALREREFVEAARSVGASDTRILVRHLLPWVLPIVVVNSSFQAGTAVLVEAGLGFLGLGDRNVVSWGAMLADAQSYLAVAWWTSVFPGAALAVMVLAMNLAGDGLAQAWNVRAPSGARD